MIRAITRCTINQLELVKLKHPINIWKCLDVTAHHLKIGQSIPILETLSLALMEELFHVVHRLNSPLASNEFFQAIWMSLIRLHILYHGLFIYQYFFELSYV